MIDLFMSFRETAFYEIAGIIVIAFCFVEIVKRCKDYYIEKRDGKAAAELETLREEEGLGSEVWEKTDSNSEEK